MNIRPIAQCEFDLISLGECMVRLSPPGHGRIEFANMLEVWIGGGEYNVSYAIARLGLRSAWVGGLVDNPLGKLILNHARGAGVDTSLVVNGEYDGIGRKARVGLNFTEVGTSVRPSVTMYDRGHSATSQLRADDVDWEKLFLQRGVRWLHTGGIFTALSPDAAATVRAAMKAAHDSGTIVSYDLNFRSKLWSSAEAQKITNDLMQYVDCLIGNEEDFQKVLGFDVEGTGEALNELPVESYKKMVQQVVQSFPSVKVVGTTLREVTSGLLNNWSAILYHDGKFYESRLYKDLEIEDRVGGGDGFCSGFAYGFLTGVDPQSCVELGAAHGALLQTTRGDCSQIDLGELQHIASGGSARIKR